MKNNTPDVFDFDGDDIKRIIIHDLNLLTNIKKSYDFVFEKMKALGYHGDFTNRPEIDLNTVKVKECKNYNWIAVTNDNTNLIIRQYNQHLTVYVRYITIYKIGEVNYKQSHYGCFTLNVNLSNLDENDDACWDNKFLELNKLIINIFTLISENQLYLVSNSAALPYPKYVKISNIYNEENISSIDKLIFCAEELSSLHMQLFAENDMIEKLKNMSDRIGTKLDNGIITSINTEFPKEYGSPYYHAIGVKVEKANNRIDFIDIYSLTKWHLKDVYQN